MASAPELKQICEELGIDSSSMLIDEMKKEIREKVDAIYTENNKLIGDSMFSKALLKFITVEYDYVLKNKKGETKSWKNL